SYGDCTNKEEKVPDLELKWYERSHFLPEYESFSAYVDDVNDYYGEGSKETSVAKHEFNPSNGVINIELEKHFKEGIGKGRFFYSLVRLDTVSDKSYTPIYQAPADQQKFGFFTRDFKKPDSNGSTSGEFSQGEYLKRFSPNLKTIDFYLNDEFFEPGNEIWRQATIETVSIMARQMQEIGVPPVRIINPNNAAGKVSGDLRHNAINMFAEPGTSLLGYGPSTSNPFTGEIISAYTNMYPGTILRGVPRQWDQFATIYNNGRLADQANVEKQVTDSIASAQQGAVATVSEEVQSESTSSGYSYEVSAEEVNEYFEQKQILSLTEQIQSHEAYSQLSGEAFDVVSETLDKEKVEEFWSRNTMFSADNVWVSATGKNSLPGFEFVAEGYIDTNTQKMKDWSELNSVQRDKVNRIFGVHNYKTTLVHEIGHNLGLRHNFEGSTDSANFHTDQMVTDYNLRGKPAMSSIMDYAPSELDIEPVLGPYDLAALRIGYKREVEVSDGKFKSLSDYDRKYANQYVQADTPENTERSEYSPLIQLELDLKEQAAESGTVALDIKEFAFCTDGNVGRNWACDRHDEGTNAEESTRYHYQYTQNLHQLFNFREDAYSFTEANTIGRYFFFRNRLMDVASQGMLSWGLLETYSERWGYDTPDALGKRACEISANDFFCHAYNAAQTSAEYMVSILATPEKTCQVKATKSGNRISYENIPLHEMYSKVRWKVDATHEYPMNCFDENLTDGLAIYNRENRSTDADYEVLAELKGGEFMNHQTASSTVNHEISDWRNLDEIDAFGVWFFRPIAAELIASRDMVRGGNTAMIDIPYVREKVDELVKHWTSGTAYSGYQFVNAAGAPVVSLAEYKPDYSEQKVSRMPYPVNVVMSWFANTNINSDTNLVSATLKTLASEASSEDPEKRFAARSFIDSISVHDTTGQADRLNHVQLELDGVRYSAGIPNTIARSMIQNAQQSNVFKVEQVLLSYVLSNRLDEARTYKTNFDTAFANALEQGAPQFGQFMSSAPHSTIIQQIGAYEVMTRAENIRKGLDDGSITDFAAALWTMTQQLVTDGILISSTKENCMYEFANGVCAVIGERRYTKEYVDIVNYQNGWISDFFAEVKESARLFEANFLQANKAHELFVFEPTIIGRFLGNDFESLKHDQVKMISKLPVVE
ncbi:hypothetical protein EKN09_29060, partial [Vibrio penaeicida]